MRIRVEYRAYDERWGRVRAAGMTERPAVSCPACGGDAEKVFSPSGIEFKGSGFYNTDQRGGSSSTAATSGSSEPAGHSCENCPHKND